MTRLGFVTQAVTNHNQQRTEKVTGGRRAKQSIGPVTGISDKDGLDETGHCFPKHDIGRIEDRLRAGGWLLTLKNITKGMTEAKNR